MPARATCSDLDIVDGLMYASYWNDGLVILDIGNANGGGAAGEAGGSSPSSSTISTRSTRRSRTSRRPGFTRGTHTAWRQRGGKYVFIADEVYRNGKHQGRQGRLVEPDVRHPAG